MTVQSLLARDFNAIVDRLASDDFTERTLARLRGGERMRLVAVGAAGAAGAAVAAAQFGAIARAIAEAAPSLSSLAVADVSYSFTTGPVIIAALLFALVGGATAIIVPGAR